MLLNDFYQIESLNVTDTEVRADIHVDADHRIYEGHFPDQPVTPGVVQVQMVKEVLSKVLDTPLKMKSLRRCKFRSVFNPQTNNSFTLTISYSKDENEFKVKAEGKTEAQSYFVLNARYAQK